MENDNLEHFGTPCELPESITTEVFDCECGAEITETIECEFCSHEGCKNCMCEHDEYWFCGDDIHFCFCEHNFSNDT